MAEEATLEEVVAAVKEAVDETIEQQVQAAIKQTGTDPELATKVDDLASRVETLENTVSTVVSHIDADLGSSKAITDDGEGTPTPATKGKERRDVFGRRVR